MNLSLAPEPLAEITQHLSEANARFNQRYPGASIERQPIHSVYGGAHLYKAGGHMRLGRLALASMDEHAPNFAVFARALGLAGAETLLEPETDIDALAVRPEVAPAVELARTIYTRVREKLAREPVEDLRIDFEDGYGYRSDAEEDGHAVLAGEQLAQAIAESALPPFIGIRVKSFAPESLERAIRTLDIVITTLAAHTGGAIPRHFVVTLPKVAIPEQVGTLADLLDLLEAHTGIAPGAIEVDLMIETAQAIVDHHGQIAAPALIQAGRGRVVSAAFGTYDYTASCDITAGEQTHDHPAADFARHALQASLAGTGVRLSDGATTVLPIGPHRASAAQPLDGQRQAENRAVVHAAWRAHYDNIRRSLRHGFYQSWDLHPAQLPARYAAVYAFFLEQLPEASRRLRAFVERAAQATLLGNTFDDAATGQGLLNFFLRGIACGALDEQQALVAGITIAELHGRSFAQIVANRTKDEGGRTKDE
ncbi:MAG TPA: aldolase/citrate lyase family protein [Roseiflexaceae bacterium]|nr:aldolase/citrate lyase family protein [Roseiflexaceae bacterium]